MIVFCPKCGGRETDTGFNCVKCGQHCEVPQEVGTAIELKKLKGYDEMRGTSERVVFNSHT